MVYPSYIVMKDMKEVINMPVLVIQPAIKDAAIEAGYPDTNTGNDPTMWVGRYFDGSVYRDLIQFDLSGLTSCVNISSATLNLYVNEVTNAAVSAYVTPYRVTQNWSENQVTWNTAPAYDAFAHGATTQLRDIGWYQWDITNLVSNWFNNVYPNYGMLLRTPETADFETKRFTTSEESANPDLRPYLTITYTCGEELTITARQFNQVSETVTTGNNLAYTTSRDISTVSRVTYFISNTGTNPAVVNIQLSADNVRWDTATGDIVVAAGETVSLIVDRLSHYSRIAYRSATAGLPTTLIITLDTQV